MKPLHIFISNVREEMKAREWNTNDLSKHANISHTAAGLLLSGEKDVRVSTIEAVAKALETDLIYLFMDKKARERWERGAHETPHSTDYLLDEGFRKLKAEFSEMKATALKVLAEIEERESAKSKKD